MHLLVFIFLGFYNHNMGICKICKGKFPVADVLGVCRRCILERWDDAFLYVREAHKKTRECYGLPAFKPEDGVIRCGLCALECRMNEGESGYCGLRKAVGGKIEDLPDGFAKVSWYLDPLPTNCVADWICPGSSEHGYYNLAVFFESCNLNCLYCQNWHFRRLARVKLLRSMDDLIKSVNDRVSCVCYFGGDPSTQVKFAIEASKRINSKFVNRKVRICWETNGLVSKVFINKVVELSLTTGGIVKFDLKAFRREIYIALTGFSNEIVFDNFKYVASFFDVRRDPPLLTASTLLVPGYVNHEEVYNIARFIASINPDIPYRILAYSPQFYMDDVPYVTKDEAYMALELAKKAGLRRVSIGNVHILR